MGYRRLTLFLAGLAAVVAVAYATSPPPARSYTKHFADGTYGCARCGQPLFSSDAKFDSGTRWPSFRAALSGGVATRPDTTGGMRRIEVLCAGCDLHLGHVFADGQRMGDTHPEAGARYCVLSASLVFAPRSRHSTRE
jgi:peptide-methionine (R)-S-oxide reductase